MCIRFWTFITVVTQTSYSSSQSYLMAPYSPSLSKERFSKFSPVFLYFLPSCSLSQNPVNLSEKKSYQFNLLTFSRWLADSRQWNSATRVWWISLPSVSGLYHLLKHAPVSCLKSFKYRYLKPYTIISASGLHI